jgi:hypothetical protein
MRITLLILIIFIVPNDLIAQLSLKGSLHDESGVPISYASVTLKENGTSIIKTYTLTNGQGRFDLKIKDDLNLRNYSINISSMGYEQKIIAITDITKELNIILKTQNIKIDEVKIKAPKVSLRGDTISYTVVQFANEKDRSIGDVLEKIPGIEVSKEGSIKYQGKPINKFYIEGMDILDEKYGIATTNIAYEDVASVQVYENHQPIRVLNGVVSSDNAAINLKINEASKSVWIGKAALGIGFSPVLWDGSLAFMRFGTKSQSINTLKSNNAGVDITSELKSLNIESYLNDRFIPTTGYFNFSSNNTGINKERTSFNNTHSFSTSELWKLSENCDIKAQVLYGYNDLTFINDKQIDYFTNSDTINIVEKENFRSIANLIDTKLTFTLNSDSLYIKNKSLVELEWNSISSEIFGTNSTNQILELPRSIIKNNFEVLKRNNKRVLGLSINTNYINFNHSLNAITDSIENRQIVALSEFHNRIESNFSLSAGVLSFSLKGGANVYSRNLNTLINGSLSENGSFKNDSSEFKYLELYASPQLEAKFKGLQLKFWLPFSYYYYSLNAKYINNSVNERKRLISPNLAITYYLTPRIYLRLQGGLQKLPLSYKKLFYGNMLTDYRNIKAGYTDFVYDDIKYSGLSFNFKNPLSMLYFNSSFSFTNYVSDVTSMRTFMGIYMLDTYKEALSMSNLYMGSARISKGIDAFNTLQSLEATYSKNNSEIFQDDIKYYYEMQSFNISYEVSMEFGKVLDIDYEFDYTLHNQSAEELSIIYSSFSTKHDLSIYINPNNSFNFFINAEYCGNMLNDRSRDKLYFFDIGCISNKNKRWQLELKLMNIFDEQYYTFNQSDALTNSTIRYYLRPRQVLIKCIFNI